jgi:hypothetical protein
MGTIRIEFDDEIRVRAEFNSRLDAIAEWRCLLVYRPPVGDP